MAILETETSIAELKKHFGKDAIFYERDGKIIMQSRPFLSNAQIKKRKERGIANCKRIHAVSILAQEILSDPIIKAEYKAKCTGKQNPIDVLIHEIFQKNKQNEG
jgi:hypothetical protein